MPTPIPEGPQARAEDLVKLLTAECGELTEPEQNLARAVALGEECDVAHHDDERLTLNTEQDAWHNWGEHRKIRAAVLRVMCLSTLAHTLVDPRGVQLLNARITGEFDIEGFAVPFDLWFEDCAFDEPIIAWNATVRTLSLQSSRVPGLEADGLKAVGGVFLRYGFHTTGEIRLMRSRIGGDLDCTDGRFNNAKGIALSTDGLKASGSVFLGSRFHASGEVRLLGSSIGGNLDCSGGRFDSEKGKALSADGLKVMGGVFLRHGFHATGEVRLPVSSIGGNLECSDGLFDNSKGKSLSADGARISSTLILRGARFTGVIELTRSRVGYLVDTPVTDDQGQPVWPEHIILEDCRYDALHTESPLDAKRRLVWLANHDRTLQKYRSPGTPPDPGVYRWLAGVLRQQGHENDADTVMVSLGWRRWVPLLRQRWRSGGQWGRGIALLLFVFSFFYGIIVGHGYARFRPLIWLLVFFGIGWFIFGIDQGRNMQPTQGYVLRAWSQAEQAGWDTTPMQPWTINAWIDEHPHPDSTTPTIEQQRWISSYPKFSPCVYAIDTFLPLVDFHQEEYWTPRSGWWAKDWYLPFHIISGWIIATLFAASFTRLARHD